MHSRSWLLLIGWGVGAKLLLWPQMGGGFGNTNIAFRGKSRAAYKLTAAANEDRQ